MKRKFKISCLLLAVMMIFMAMPVLAADTIELDGEVHTVEFYSSQTPHLEFESRTTDLTAAEIAELDEALLNADYNDYEIITGIGYEIKRVYLQYGYTIDFILIYNIGSASLMRNTFASGIARVSVKDTSGREVGYVALSATFFWTGSSVTFSSADMASGNPPSASWSNVSYTTGGSSSTTMYAVSTPTLNISGGGSYSYRISVGCDKSGNISVINA